MGCIERVTLSKVTLEVLIQNDLHREAFSGAYLKFQPSSTLPNPLSLLNFIFNTVHYLAFCTFFLHFILFIVCLPLRCGLHRAEMSALLITAGTLVPDCST